MNDKTTVTEPAVASEIADGDELSTAQISREKKLNIATVYRWMAKGLPAAIGGRVRLEAVKRGKSWLTSRAALRRFFARLPTSQATAGGPNLRTVDDSSEARRTAAVQSHLQTRHGI